MVDCEGKQDSQEAKRPRIASPRAKRAIVGDWESLRTDLEGSYSVMTKELRRREANISTIGVTKVVIEKHKQGGLFLACQNTNQDWFNRQQKKKKE